jgi:hypothetical protein
MVTENYEFEYWNIRGHSQRAAIIYLYSSKLSLFKVLIQPLQLLDQVAISSIQTLN